MALSFGRWILYSNKELEVLNKDELLFIMFHELEHTKRLPTFNRQHDERTCQKQAIRKMMNLGYTFHDLLMMEINHRIFTKYGLTLKQYREYMKP